MPLESSIGLMEEMQLSPSFGTRISRSATAELRRTRSAEEPVCIIESAGICNAYVNSVAPGWFQAVTQKQWRGNVLCT